MKEKAKSMRVVVVKWHYRANGLFKNLKLVSVISSFYKAFVQFWTHSIELTLRWLDPVFWGVPSYVEALWYPHLYFYRKSNT